MRKILFVILVVQFFTLRQFECEAVSFGSTEGAIAFIKELESNYLGMLQDETIENTKKYKKFIKALNEHFDVKVIGAFSLGRNIRLFSKSDKERFYKIFIKMLAAVYVDKFRHLGNVKLNHFHAKRTDNTRVEEYVVTCNVTLDNQSEVKLKWNVIVKDQKYKVINVSLDGISVNILQRDEFAQQISSLGGKMDAFLLSLEKKYGWIND